MSFGAIFDMDGVLVDSSAAHYESWQRLGDEVGTPFPRDLFDRTFGMHNNQIIPMWLGPEADAHALGLRKETLYRAAVADAMKPLPGAVDLVNVLHDAGFILAVASSGPRANVELIVRLLGLDDLFHTLATGDEVIHGKPNPEIFLNAMAGIGVLPQMCVVIEDAPQGVEAALASGASVVAITSSRPARDLADADRIVDSLDELSPAVLRTLVEARVRSSQR